MRPFRVAPLALFLAAACGPAETEEATSQDPSAADTVAMAAAQYDAAAFDTVSWETPEGAWVRGSVIFSYSCTRCHGQQGYGDGGFVTQGDTVRPPSFHQGEWRFADDLEGLREFIYTGSEGGMPHWGLEGLDYRDVDAVARFIKDSLRTSG